MNWFSDNAKKNVNEPKEEYDEDEIVEQLTKITKRLETIENTEMKLLRDELIDLKREERRRTKFLEEMLMKIVEQAKPLVKQPTAVEQYLAKKDGASLTQSVKEIQKSKLPG